VALQGTPSLFLVIWGRRALGFGSSMRGEREQCLHYFGFIYLFIIIFIYFICGDPKMGYNTYNGSYNGLTYNYENPPIIKGPALVFQTEIDGLTRSGRCFTHEKQDRQ